MSSLAEKIIKLAKERSIISLEELKRLKREAAKGGRENIPNNRELIRAYADLTKKGEISFDPKLARLLVSKRTRTLSGVSVVAVLTASHPCFNYCLYCPKESQMPKSYLSNEPAVMRAIKLEFDPYRQVKKRMEALTLNGHDTSKLELIVMGGTFSHLPTIYQYWFILNCFWAANGVDLTKSSKLNNLNQKAKKIWRAYFNGAEKTEREVMAEGAGTMVERLGKLPEKILTKVSRGLAKVSEISKTLETSKTSNQSLLPAMRPIKLTKEEQAILELIKQELELAKRENRSAKHRIVGLTLETRPDCLDLAELIKFRELGCTRVEIGVQSVFNEVLKKNDRGHGRREIIKATKLLKELGFKINYHLMPGLWGSSLKKDQALFTEVFSDQRFRPDMLKIYPCVVVAGSPLFSVWQKGDYKPYSNQELSQLLVAVKKKIPRYVRINRLIRDIPTDSIVAGPNVPNLRELLKREGAVCSCIRCREAGRTVWSKAEAVKLKRTNYKASNGLEIFLEFVTGKSLHAFLRLRIPAFVQQKKPAPVKELAGSAMIREVHSYGQVAPVGKKTKDSSQHQGFGKRLIQEAERIVKEEYGLKKIAVISAEGTKEYYSALGFKEKGNYLVKSLD